MRNQRIIQFANPITLQEAVVWLKNNTYSEANFDILKGSVQLWKTHHLAMNPKALYNYFYNNIHYSTGKKIYRNTENYYNRNRFAGTRITHLDISEYITGETYYCFWDKYAFEYNRNCNYFADNAQIVLVNN